MKLLSIILGFLIIFCSCKKNDLVRIYTIQPTDISLHSITCGGYIEVVEGSPNIESCGMVCSLNSDPLVGDNMHIEADSVVQRGAFKCQLTDLLADTTYYLLPYAKWDNEIHYAILQAPVAVRTTYNKGHSGPAGGIIIYLMPDSLHGLEMSPVDLAPTPWGCNGLDISTAEGIDIFDGQNNTQEILNACSETPTAASVCNDYVLNGYDDWYLPSIRELEQAYYSYFVNQDIHKYYYSSSQYSPSAARVLSSHNSTWGYTNKDNDFRIRAIRYF